MIWWLEMDDNERLTLKIFAEPCCNICLSLGATLAIASCKVSFADQTLLSKEVLRDEA